jgi:hypothetical protein
MTRDEEEGLAVIRAIIVKLETGLDRPFEEASSGAAGPVPLSINERRIVAEILRRACLPRKEWNAYKNQRELKEYEAIKKLASYGVEHGQRQDWVQRYFNKKKIALERYFIRARKKR